MEVKKQELSMDYGYALVSLVWEASVKGKKVDCYYSLDGRVAISIRYDRH